MHFGAQILGSARAPRCFVRINLVNPVLLRHAIHSSTITLCCGGSSHDTGTMARSRFISRAQSPDERTHDHGTAHATHTASGSSAHTPFSSSRRNACSLTLTCVRPEHRPCPSAAHKRRMCRLTSGRCHALSKARAECFEVKPPTKSTSCHGRPTHGASPPASSPLCCRKRRRGSGE